MEQRKLESVLVTGGDGFVGWNLVGQIQKTEPNCQIAVMDLPTSLPRYPNVKYFDIETADKDAVTKAMSEIRPHVIFHAACTYSLSLPAATHFRVNAEGTLNVLEAAKIVGTAKAFLYHSSSSVVENGTSDILNATEDMPPLFAPEQKYPYPLSKALAERAVFTANTPGGMLTTALRPASSFGPADFEKMAKLIEVAESGNANMQIGDGKNMYDMAFIENTVHVHLLAAQALLRDWEKHVKGEKVNEAMRVDGEAFFVTDDEPWLYWEFHREIAKAVGFPVKPGDVKVIPRWVAMVMAVIAECFVWVISFGRGESGLTRFGVRYSCLNRTFSCEKAKRVLGYRPVVGTREGLEKSIAWFRETGRLFPKSKEI